MTFTGFTTHDFATFHVDGLEGRMHAIQTRIQPKFQAIGPYIAEHLSVLLGSEMFVHIAKHARRSVNAPHDTWMAFAANKRGYKQHPHFQLGLFDDHLFVWLAFIYELPDKARIASTFLAHQKTIEAAIPDDYVVSLDHMKKDAQPLSALALQPALERFRDVKKAEFLIGRHFAIDDPLLQDGDAFVAAVLDTYSTLAPLYKLAYA